MRISDWSSDVCSSDLLIARAGLHQSAFTGNSQTYYIEGRHDYVRDLCRDLRAADLGNFRRMEDETLAAEQDAARERDAEPDDPEEDCSATKGHLRVAFAVLEVCMDSETEQAGGVKTTHTPNAPAA